MSGPFSAFSFRSFGRPAPRPERALQTQAVRPSHPFRPPLQTVRLPARHTPSQCLHSGRALRTVDLLEPGGRARPAARGSAAMERGFRLADGATNCTNARLLTPFPFPTRSSSRRTYTQGTRSPMTTESLPTFAFNRWAGPTHAATIWLLSIVFSLFPSPFPSIFSFPPPWINHIQ